jgi:hypothetical protein
MFHGQPSTKFQTETLPSAVVESDGFRFRSTHPTDLRIFFLRIFAVNRAIGGNGGTPVLARDFVRSRKTDCFPAAYTHELFPPRDHA